MSKKKNSELEQLTERLTKIIAKSSIQYDVLAPGDKVMVAVSGGKDSYCLLYLLDNLRKRLPFEIELLAVHVNQGQPGYDGSPLERWLAESGLPFEIARQDTYSVVARHTKPGGTYCAICSRMRRGVLYSWAEKHGCNKVALGHHRDDTVATLLMNLFYGGKIQAMPAKYTTNDGRFEVIRPMIEVAEDDLRRLSRLVGFPIVPCGLCSSQEDHKRKEVGSLLDELEKDNPQIRNIMLGAIKNVRPTHLLDPTVGRISNPTNDS